MLELTTVDYTKKLPTDVLKSIVCKLSPYDLLQIKKVSQRYKTLINDDHLWLSICGLTQAQFRAQCKKHYNAQMAILDKIFESIPPGQIMNDGHYINVRCLIGREAYAQQKSVTRVTNYYFSCPYKTTAKCTDFFPFVDGLRFHCYSTCEWWDRHDFLLGSIFGYQFTTESILLVASNNIIELELVIAKLSLYNESLSYASKRRVAIIIIKSDNLPEQRLKLLPVMGVLEFPQELMTIEKSTFIQHESRRKLIIHYLAQLLLSLRQQNIIKQQGSADIAINELSNQNQFNDIQSSGCIISINKLYHYLQEKYEEVDSTLDIPYRTTLLTF